MTAANTTEDAPSSSSSSFDICGKILRKKNIRPEYLKLAILPNGEEKTITVYIPRTEGLVTYSPSKLNFLYLNATIHVRGHINSNSFPHVETCTLLKCAPNIKMIKEVLALPNCTSYASTLSMDWAELQTLVTESKSRKIIVNTIIERLTGQRAKAPPKYRPGRVKQSDLDILKAKEVEGQDATNSTWTLCHPCQSLNNIMSFERKKEPVVNLPNGAADIVSAHGKLTRSEYLETKKNNQTIWFIERIRQFENELLLKEQQQNQEEVVQQRMRFLDVGGGRGDLAVQIACHFPTSHVVVVDSNERSVNAGKEYAAKCGVNDRINFVCMDFTEYVEQYHGALSSVVNGDDNSFVNFVVALHACGDLSDMALSFAKSNGCNFIICPCCYPKRYLAPFVPHWHTYCNEKEVSTLSRLVELDDHREVSRRAMVVVNSMRQSAFVDQKDNEVKLEEFDDKISKRNIALVRVGY